MKKIRDLKARLKLSEIENFKNNQKKKYDYKKD